MRMFTKKMARLRDRARKAADRFRAESEKVDADCSVPASHLETLWESGFMTLLVPRGHGGHGASLAEATVVIEELARGSASAALVVLLQALSTTVLAGFADEKQARKWFDKVVNNRWMLAFALSEPDPGPREKPAVTTAKRAKSGFVIQGRKTFVSGAREADLVIVLAVSSPKARLKKALSAFAVPAGASGMIPGREFAKSGLRGVPAVELVFQGCRVPAGSRLGRAGQGYAITQKSIIATAPLAAALACGIMAEALDYTIQRTGTRDPDSGPLSEFQPLELALAEMMAGLDSSLAITWAAAGAIENDAPGAERLARECKWLATENAVRCTDLAAGMLGMEQSLQGSYMERLSRDARAAGLVLGPNHIHRIEVARKLIGRR